MRSFTDYLQYAFYQSSFWDIDNSYAEFTATARALLYFPIPHGLHLTASTLASPSSASSYTLSTTNAGPTSTSPSTPVSGSLSYLYSSLPLHRPSLSPRSNSPDLRTLVTGYRHVADLLPRSPDSSSLPWERAIQARAKIGRKDTLLYGRLYLPRSELEALYVRRLAPTRLLRISCVSSAGGANGSGKGASVLALLQQDVGRWCAEGLWSSDGALLGVRGLYNFGGGGARVVVPATSIGSASDASADESTQGVTQYQQIQAYQHQPPQYGRFSAGMEIYYGLLNKSGGMSTGLRFTTLPRHTGFPYTMTLTLNPLMGNVSSTYAVKAGRNVALCSQFDFNFYSYESDLRLGLELWRRRRKDDAGSYGGGGAEWAEQMIRPEWRRPATAAGSTSIRDVASAGIPTTGSALSAAGELAPDEDVLGVVKARWDQNWRIGVLWEGRMKELLFSMGVSCDLKRREQIFTAVGAELQYSS